MYIRTGVYFMLSTCTKHRLALRDASQGGEGGGDWTNPTGPLAKSKQTAKGALTPVTLSAQHLTPQHTLPPELPRLPFLDRARDSFSQLQPFMSPSLPFRPRIMVP